MYLYFFKQQGSSMKRVVSVVIFLLVGLILGLSSASYARLPEFSRVKAPLVSLEEAREYFTQQEELAALSGRIAALRGTTTPTIGIQELVNQLNSDPDLIYEYVHNTIDYTPIFGSLKGALGALLDRQGNDFDQASLLVELLRAAGFTANYVYGVIRLDPAQVENWLGTSDPDALGWLLGSSGIPGDIYVEADTSLAFLDLEHMWVTVNIDGTDYAFDPSFKQYTETAPIDLTSAMGYNQADFLSQALSGATVDADFVQHLNTTNIVSALSDYASNLVSYIQANHPDAELEDIVGGKTIQAATIPLRQTSLPYQQSIIGTWTEIPQNYKTTLNVRHLGIDRSFDSSEIYGKRLTLFYDSSNAPELRLDGTTVAVGTSSTPGTSQSMTLTADHPYVGNYGDQSQNFSLRVGGSYFIINGWAGTSEAIVERHKHAFRQNLQAGGDLISEPVLGESLALIGFTWLAESTRMDEIADQLYNTRSIRHHIIGLAGQEDGPFIDLPLCLVSPISLENDPVVENSRFFNSGGHNSAFESGVIEQTQPYEAVSTVKLLHFANARGYKIFEVNSASEFDALLAAPDGLRNYAGSEASIRSYLQAGYRLLLPSEGNLTIGNWTGSTYLAISGDESGIGYIIGGSLNGGYATETGLADGTQQSQTTRDSKGRTISRDPIGIPNGGGVACSADVQIGSDARDGLSLIRSYDSQAALHETSFGAGWTHNFDITLEKGSDGFRGMGTDSPIDAAATIADQVVTHSLLEGGKTKETLLVATLAQQWNMGQLSDNIISVKKPNSTHEFVKLSDGSYNAASEDSLSLTQESDGSYRLSTKQGTHYDFTAEGALTTWTDLHNNSIDLTYSEGKLQSLSNNFGRSLSLSYAGDYIEQVTDDAGRSVSYEYDADGNMIAFIDPEGHTVLYEYDLPGRLAEISYPSNPSSPYMTNVYDSEGRVVSQTDPRGNIYSYEYGENWTRETDPAGHTMTWYTNQDGLPIRKELPDGQTVTMAYDRYQRLIQETFPEGDFLEYQYDSRHNPTQITYHPKPDSGESPLSTTLSYESMFNQVQTITDQAGRTTTFHYDTDGNLIQVDQPEVNGELPQWFFTHHSRGQVETMADPEGTVTRYSYDAVTGNLLQTLVDEGGLNITYQMGYDDVGNLIRFTDPKGHVTSFEYDAMRRLIRVVPPLSSPFEYSYDADGRLLSISRGGQTTSFTYTPSGKKKSVTNPEGHVATYDYTALDRLWRITNAENQMFEFVYDAVGNVLGLLDAQGRHLVEYSFTPNGKPATFTDANGNTTTYEYNAFDRLAKASYPDGSYEEFSYDAVGNLTQQRSRAGAVVTYSYDSLNRFSGMPSQGIQYHYDLLGKLLEATDAGGTLQQSYDAVGRLLSVVTPDNNSIAYEYDAAGNRIRLTYPDGYFLRYNYDALDRPEQILEGGTNLLAQFSYDALGRRSQLSYGNGVSTSYSYEPDDDLESLTFHFTDSEVSFDYSYNALHKRIGGTVSDDRFLFSPYSADSTDYTPNSLNQYSQVKDVDFNYDESGNLTWDGVNSYSYNAENRLIGATTPQHTATYSYDPFRRRIAKSVDGEQSSYLYDRDDVIVEYDGQSGQFLRRYIYGPYIDEPLGMKTDTETYYYSIDGQNSVIALSDASGNIVERYIYGPYGEIEQTSSVENPYFYTGRRYDPETGLYHYRLRAYDAELGRFLQVDPLNYLGGPLLYAYVGNDPLNWIDPKGLARVGGRRMKVSGSFAGQPLEGVLKEAMLQYINTLRPLHPGLLSHWQIIFDKPVKLWGQTITNIGFGPNGLFTDTRQEIIDLYEPAGEHIPDEIVLRAIEQIFSTEAELKYSLIGGVTWEHGRITLKESYHCRTFTDQVFGTARELVHAEETWNPETYCQ